MNWRAPGDPNACGAGTGKVQIDNPLDAPSRVDAPPRFGFTVTNNPAARSGATDPAASQRALRLLNSSGTRRS